MSTVKRRPSQARASVVEPAIAPTRFGPVAGRDGKEFMASLAKGLAVLAAFGPARPSMSLTEAAAVAGLSRAAARRVLLTLGELGYVEQHGRDFALSPRILDLGFAYLSILSWVERAEPLLKELSSEFQEAAAAATLHGFEAIVVAQSSAAVWIMSSTTAIGTRQPAFHSALGRIQLGHLDDEEIWKRLRAAVIEQYTPSTITDLGALVERVKSDRAQGFSMVDEELERGLRALAVPLVSRSGTVVGAINLSGHSARTTRNEMRDRYLPRLRETAQTISKFIV